MCEASYKMLRILQEYMFLIIVSRFSTNKLYSKQCLFISLINLIIHVYCRSQFTPWLKCNVYSQSKIENSHSKHVLTAYGDEGKC